MQPSREIVVALQQRGIRAVAFDLDQTIVGAHSQGRMTSDRLPQFLASVKPDFCLLANELHAAGIGLAVATHSDRAEGPDSPYILGDDLVAKVLERAVPELIHLFFVVAYQPKVCPLPTSFLEFHDPIGTSNSPD
eukprot:c1118_g1_i1.p1 GENE.c1118_g1_i1~~c1118_g1_i1.p1  ORF type:complete len:135 (+),score=19.64 c1118_g1_i1:27-431(+)